MTAPFWTPDLLDVLADIGPAPIPAIRAALSARGIDQTDADLHRELQARADVRETADGWLSLWPIVDGAALTHVVTEDELACGILQGDGDLELWARLADGDGIRTAPTGHLHTVYTLDDLPPGAVTGLKGPDGWLAGIEAEDIVALRLRDGVLHLDKLTEVAPPNEEATTILRRALAAADEAARRYDDDPDAAILPGADLDEIVVNLLIEHPGALAEPLPPLSTLLMLTGLYVHRGYAVLPGTGWVDGVILDADARLRLAVARGHLRRAAYSDDAPTASPQLRTLARSLHGDLDVALALPDNDPATGIGLVAMIASSDDDPARAVPAYLLAQLADDAGKQETAADLLDEALSADPDYAPALVLAGLLAAERSDAFTADTLLRRAGQPSDGPDRGSLRELLRAPAGTVSRNQPCPCGSGRKYKACCGSDRPHPLPRRALWRYQRAALYAVRARNDDVEDLLDALGGDDAPADGAEILAIDLGLFEGELLGDYLEQRGTLMPVDERALVEQWQGVRIGLYEVVDVRDRAVTLRRLPDDEPVTITDRMLSTQVQPLDLLLVRLVPDGESLAIFCPPQLIPRNQREAFLAVLDDDPDAYDLAELLSPRLPELRTTEGEELLWCTARYAVDDVDHVWEQLREGGLSDEDDTLAETAEVPGHGTVHRGSIRRLGDSLMIETNALERLRRLQERLLDAAPGARLLSESSRSAADMLAEGGDSEGTPPVALPPDALEEVQTSMEQRWLEESVPALGGLTPRQAAADPDTRPRLVSLLDDFEWHERRTPEGGFTMRTDRLRAALGVESSR